MTLNRDDISDRLAAVGYIADHDVATALWLITTAGFGWYVRHLANYNVLYGSVGTSIALLVWMYLMSLIALLGCEFNAAYERAVCSQ